LPGQIIYLSLKQAFTIACNGPVSFADLKGGFLPEAGSEGPASNQSLLDWPGGRQTDLKEKPPSGAGIGRQVILWTILKK
jgi:hypothetical protein